MPGFLSRRLNFISNDIQKFTLDIDIPAILSDHSPILISFSKEKQNKESSGIWEFNKSLLLNSKFKENKTTHSKYK